MSLSALTASVSSGNCVQANFTEVAVSQNNNEVQIYRRSGDNWTLEATLAEVSFEVELPS